MSMQLLLALARRGSHMPHASRSSLGGQLRGQFERAGPQPSSFLITTKCNEPMQQAQERLVQEQMYLSVCHGHLNMHQRQVKGMHDHAVLQHYCDVIRAFTTHAEYTCLTTCHNLGAPTTLTDYNASSEHINFLAVHAESSLTHCLGQQPLSAFSTVYKQSFCWSPPTLFEQHL